MARTSSSDPMVKFRFQVTIFQNLYGLLTSGVTSLGSNEDSNLTPSGFMEVTPPKASVKEINYRENIHGSAPTKIPGLTTFDPITLKKGSTRNQAVYNWFQKVDNEAGTINKFTDSLAGLSAIPFQQPNYRRDVLISTFNRDGSFNKHWLLYNAWPKEYKGGDTLSATTSDILIEEVTLTYDIFLEVQGKTMAEALRNARIQSELAARDAAVAAAISAGSGLISGIL